MGDHFFLSLEQVIPYFHIVDGNQSIEEVTESIFGVAITPKEKARMLKENTVNFRFQGDTDVTWKVIDEITSEIEAVKRVYPIGLCFSAQ